MIFDGNKRGKEKKFIGTKNKDNRKKYTSVVRLTQNYEKNRIMENIVRTKE